MSSILKIAFIVRSTLFKIVGGDNLQVVNTAKELKKLGVDVDIKLASDKIDYYKYDLIHLFNLIRPADHLVHIEKANRPFVLSSIYLDYSEFDNHGRSFLQKQFFKIAGKNGAEYLKNNYRFLRKQDKLVSLEYLFGHARAVRKIIENCALLLPNSRSEYLRLRDDYKIEKDYHIVPNGIDSELFGVIPEVDRINDQILCVGQIYGLKNQYRLIEAVKSLGAKLKIIGKSPPNHRSYYDLCRKISGPLIEFKEFMPQSELLKYYAQSHVHALPSWFETTGLSSLEAGAMGCNLVVGSGGDTKEYFSEKASFCNAYDFDSIKSALEIELNKKVDYSFREKVLTNYTWKVAAKESLYAYKKVLKIE